MNILRIDSVENRAPTLCLIGLEGEYITWRVPHLNRLSQIPVDLNNLGRYHHFPNEAEEVEEGNVLNLNK